MSDQTPAHQNDLLEGAAADIKALTALVREAAMHDVARQATKS